MVFTVKESKSVNINKIRPAIQSLQPSIVEWRRELHQKPELGFAEYITAEFIGQKLKQWQIPHQTGIAKTGIVATITGKSPGKVLAIRADMDALPIQEANEVPYKSQHEGKMHACGHDGHTAIALATAYYLSQHRDDPGGAKPMIEAGALKNPDVDAIIGLHLWNNLPLGTVGVRDGALMAAVECFRLSILGKGGHGAMPDQTVDSIVVASQIVNALQTIVSRNVNPRITRRYGFERDCRYRPHEWHNSLF